MKQIRYEILIELLNSVHNLVRKDGLTISPDLASRQKIRIFDVEGHKEVK